MLKKIWTATKGQLLDTDEEQARQARRGPSFLLSYHQERPNNNYPRADVKGRPGLEEDDAGVLRQSQRRRQARR